MASPLAPLLSRSAGLAIFALIALQVVLALGGVRSQGVTNDETAHLTAGYAYWTLNDYRLQPENGNLPQRWCALPLLALGPTLDPAARPEWWRNSDVWRIAHHFFYSAGNSSDWFLWWARVAMMTWGILLALLVHAWSRRLWGPGAALFSLALVVLCPTVLAHAPLATSDVTATVCLLAALAGWWHGAHRLTLGTVVGGGLLTGLAFIAKFSAVLLVPAFLGLTVLRLLATTPLTWHCSPRHGAFNTIRAKLPPLLGLTLAHGVITVAVIWTAFGWRYQATAPSFDEPIAFYKTNENEIAAGDGVIGAVVDWTREHRLLPAAYIQGFVFVLVHAQERAAFLAGDYRTDGWWWFFPAAFFWKSTLGELLIAGLLGALLLARTVTRRLKAGSAARQALYHTAPLWGFAFIYGITSLTSPLNIGQRHILPLYAVLFILAGGLWRAFPRPRYRTALLAPVALSALACATVFPHFLTYFNGLAGGPTQGWRKLVDSSLDWGQGLPALYRWLDEHQRPDEPVYLSYFGSDDFRYRGIRATPLAPMYQNYEPRPFIDLHPGLYCIGASMLQDVYSPVAGAWTIERELEYQQAMTLARRALADGSLENRIVDFGREGTKTLWLVERLRFARLTQYLRLRPPEAIVANHILIYRLAEAEIDTALNGTLTQLADLMDEAPAKKP